MKCSEKAEVILKKANEINLLYESRSLNFRDINSIEYWDSSTVNEFIQTVLKIEEKISDLYKFLR